MQYRSIQFHYVWLKKWTAVAICTVQVGLRIACTASIIGP